MRKFTLLTSVLLTAPFAVGNVSAQCVATQDCATLGYTEISCESGGIKCPFGNAWACKGNADTGTEDSENGRDNPDCTYGAIYYSDGTCVKDFISEKTAIGVVVYDENDEKWIMSLENISFAVYTNVISGDISSITNYVSKEEVINDFKSCENTSAIIMQNVGGYYASKMNNYAPENAKNTMGKWCIPAAGIWNVVQKYLPDIEAGLALARGQSLITPYNCNLPVFISSSEYSSDYMWGWSLRSFGFHNWDLSYYEFTNVSKAYNSSSSSGLRARLILKI